MRKKIIMGSFLAAMTLVLAVAVKVSVASEPVLSNPLSGNTGGFTGNTDTSNTGNNLRKYVCCYLKQDGHPKCYEANGPGECKLGETEAVVDR